MFDLTICISTCNDRITNLINWKFDARFEYLVLWQNSSDFFFDSSALPENVRVICLSSYGVAVSRNYGLNICKTKWIWFMDDDVYIPMSSMDELIKLLSNFDESNILIAAVDWGDKILNKRFYGRTKSRLSVTSVGTMQIICNPQRAVESKSFFPVNMGAGSKYPVCDEPVFLFRMIKNANVHLCGIPQVLVAHHHISSGFNLGEHSHLISRAMFFREVFGFPICFFMSAGFFVKHWKKIKWKFPYLFYFLKPN
jgi:glycosyltransferase involved in cell wall biosynthesis